MKVGAFGRGSQKVNFTSMNAKASDDTFEVSGSNDHDIMDNHFDETFATGANSR